MELIEDDYRPEITSQSEKELAKLSKWQKENQGDWSSIIGGWAVWSYCRDSFGSRDIDIVLPEEIDKQAEIIQTYFPQNEIKEYNEDFFGTRKYFAKDIEVGKTKDEIVFDLFYPDQPRIDRDNLGVNVDWKWVFKYFKAQSIGKNAFINVPHPELLLPLKIVAALSRAEFMRTHGDSKRGRSKLWKDYYDVAILSKNVKFNQKDLEMHMGNVGIFENLTNPFLDGYIARMDALARAGVDYQQVANSIPKLKKPKT